MNFDNMNQALTLLAIGMTTVFVVLGLVIALGKLLVAFVNKYCPEEEKPVQQPSASASSVNPKIAAVIGAAIQQKFAGKAIVEKIEKI